MAEVYLCDGCSGKEIDSSTVAIGFIRKRSYCSECAIDVQVFFEARDGLHESLAQTWEKKLQQLKDTFKALHPSGVLPDE